MFQNVKFEWSPRERSAGCRRTGSCFPMIAFQPSAYVRVLRTPSDSCRSRFSTQRMLRLTRRQYCHDHSLSRLPAHLKWANLISAAERHWSHCFSLFTRPQTVCCGYLCPLLRSHAATFHLFASCKAGVSLSASCRLLARRTYPMALTAPKDFRLSLAFRHC